MEEEPGEKKQSTNGEQAEQAEQAETAEREASTAQVKVHAMNGSRQEPQKCDKTEEEEEEADKVEDKEGKPDEKDAKEESAEGEEPEVQEEEQQQHKEVEAETAPQVDLEVGEKADQLGTAIIADKPVKAENKTDKEGAATLENVDDKKGDEEEEMEEQQEEEDEVEEEDDRLSATSSPSALHIHLEEDIKDEAIVAGGNEKETADGCLPLISNVVSLSGSSPSPAGGGAGGTESDDSPSGGSSNNRRATLRLKRGIEISFDVDSNGQPVTVNPCGDIPTKKVRLDEEEDGADLSQLDMEGATKSLAGVQKDIRTLRFMAKQKEKEWNSILKLMKVKEELQAKLMRRKEVLKITSGKSGRSCTASDLQQPQQQQQQQQEQLAATSTPNLQTFINQSLKAVASGKSSAYSAKSVLNVPPTQSASASHQNHGSKSNRQRPILPKPMQMHPELQQMWSHPAGTSVDPPGFADSHMDARNRQGIISVQSLIADYRAKHPEEHPMRGRRIRQPSKIGGPDLNLSHSPTPPLNTSAVAPEASSMSFKDVLLQFAKMSSRQSQSNPAEMIQLAKESAAAAAAATSSTSSSSNNSSNSSSTATTTTNNNNNSSSSSSSSSNNNLGVGTSSHSNGSSSAALQNLAAARNARSSPAISAGSILQNALSGGRSNPNFAPTLAQLLTNPATEQQPPPPPPPPQQQQQLPQHTAAPSIPAVSLTVTSTAAAAEGHASMTSDRAEHNDDIIVLGGSVSGRIGSSGSGSTSSRIATGSGSFNGGGEVPKCQGCNDLVAQFVCAGCSSQWYCSRECQVAAWEDHSENCVG